MKKGFTLIELLAVIVILAIIALIATPIVLNIINDARESSDLRSAEFYLHAVEHTIADAVLNRGGLVDGDYPITPQGNLCVVPLDSDRVCSKENTLIVEVNGNKPKDGTITISKGDIADVSIKLNNNTIVKNSKGELVYKLAPGLYDENDNLLISWEDLTSLDYKSFTYTFYNMDLEITEEITAPILRIDENGVLYSAYDNYSPKNYIGEYLTGKLVLDESVKSIGNDAFNGCKSLKEVIIPNSVISIENSAFSDTSLEKIKIPSSVISIGDSAFFGTGLEEIKIPSSVISIGNDAFRHCTNLKEITIPNSVTTIGSYAFSGTNLASITISNSVISIGEGIFYDCINLTTINYRGTEGAWNNIDKGFDWDTNTPENKKINYNYVG